MGDTPAVQVQTFSNLVIGIDFGTTFTGVAYFHTLSDKSNGDNRDAAKIAENITVIKTWPNPNQQYLEKTPSIISYKTDPPTWGGSVKPFANTNVEHFKLGLESGASQHYDGSDLIPTDGFWHPLHPDKKPIDFAADYLTCVQNFVQQTFLPRHYGKQFLQNQSMSYIVTVPAIWSDAAKALTRQAAIRAGIKEASLTLITEPEAAALFCATTCVEADLDEGDRFLVVDAGGGTVDLIAYKILSRGPFEIQECSLGTGQDCGAIRLDQGFEALLIRKLGRHAGTMLTDKRRIELRRHFDSFIKRQFNPLDSDCEDEYEIPFAGSADIPDIGLEAGYLKIGKEEIQKIFDSIFNRIYTLIEGQIKEVKLKDNSRLKTLFLVGGLGSNQYLMQFLKKKLENTNIDVQMPIAGYTAIMRGAVLYGLGLHLVKERLMRRSYGVTSHPTFIAGVHPQHRRFVDVDGTERCKDVMDWYASRGNSMENNIPVIRSFVVNYRPRVYRTPGPLLYSSILFVCESDVPSKYKNSTVTPLCKVKVDLRKLPAGAFQKKDGSSGSFYQAKYDLGLSFGSELVFKFLYQGRVIGSANARYF